MCYADDVIGIGLYFCAGIFVFTGTERRASGAMATARDAADARITNRALGSVR